MMLYLRGGTPDGRGGFKGGKYWVKFYVNGKPRRRPLRTRDRRAAELKAAELIRKAELAAAGAVDPFEEHRECPLDDHLTDFETALAASGVTDKHAGDRLKCLRAYRDAVGARGLADLDATRAGAWLAGLRKTGERGEAKMRGRSARTVNRHIAALRQFGRWLVRERRLPFDPFVGLRPLNEAADRRHVRRSPTAEEVARIVEAARRRPLEDATRPRKIRGAIASPKLSPAEEDRLRALGAFRALVYATGYGTGLRRGELGRVRKCDLVRLDGERPEVNVPAASAKSRKDQSVPLRADLAAALAAHVEALEPTALVFPAEDFPTIKTFKKDMKAAGIPYRDEQGRAMDFHAFGRVGFVSGLAAAGVHPKIAQALARHSTVELTMRAYTDVRVLDLQGAVERLPAAVPSGPAGDAPPTSPTEQLCPPLCPSTVRQTDSKGLTFTKTQDKVRGAPNGSTAAKPREIKASRGVGAQGLEPWTDGLKGRCSAG